MSGFIKNLDITKSFQLFLLLVCGLFFIAPLVYFEIFGFFTTIQNPYTMHFERPLVYRLVFLNCFPLLLTCLIISKLPKFGIKELHFHKKYWLFIAAAFTCEILSRLLAFSNLVPGIYLGRTSLIIGFYEALMIGVLYADGLNAVAWVAVWLVWRTMCGNKGGQFIALSFFLTLVSFYPAVNSRLVKLMTKENIKRLFVIMLIASPIVFHLGRYMRTLSNKDNYEAPKPNFQDYANPIFARLFLIEAPMIANRETDQQKRAEFYKIYSPTRQLKQTVARIFHLNYFHSELFDQDIRTAPLPNIYYRYLFLNEPYSSIEKYASIPMTIPGYLAMYVPDIVNVVIYTTFLVLSFMFFSWTMAKVPAVGIAFALSFPEFLTFFDISDSILTFIYTLQIVIIAFLANKIIVWCFKDEPETVPLAILPDQSRIS